MNSPANGIRTYHGNKTFGGQGCPSLELISSILHYPVFHPLIPYILSKLLTNFRPAGGLVKQLPTAQAKLATPKRKHNRI